MITRERAYQLRALIEQAAASLSDEVALTGVELFPHWNGDGIEYKVDERVSYNGILFKCLQAHTSQTTWMPDVSPSLWVRVDNPAEEWPEWIQPLGATDAYALGAKVSHNGKHWTSDVDNNVWEPPTMWTEAV